MPAVLFDIDGTLIRSGNNLHHEAFEVALRQVYGVSFDLRTLGPGGRTDRWLMREVLRRTGVDDVTAEGRLNQAFQCMTTFYLDNAQDLSPYVLPGVRRLLEKLRDARFSLGLITGNLEPIALSKMRRAGLESFFTFGGYGATSEIRADVVLLAFREAETACAGLGKSEVVVVGDTPFDVEAAHAHALRCIGVLTGPYTEEELLEVGADLVVPDLTDSNHLCRWIELATSEPSEAAEAAS